MQRKRMRRYSADKWGNKKLCRHEPGNPVVSAQLFLKKQVICTVRCLFFYKYCLISAINASYSASERNFCCGFMANTPPHSNSSVYFGTRWKCR